MSPVHALFSRAHMVNSWWPRRCQGMMFLRTLMSIPPLMPTLRWRAAATLAPNSWPKPGRQHTSRRRRQAAYAWALATEPASRLFDRNVTHHWANTSQYAVANVGSTRFHDRHNILFHVKCSEDAQYHSLGSGTAYDFSSASMITTPGQPAA